jgi:hypothetical protein
MKRNMSWKLVKHNTPPRLISARIAPLDPEKKSELAQVVIHFDAEQVSPVISLSRRRQGSVIGWS